MRNKPGNFDDLTGCVLALFQVFARKQAKAQGIHTGSCFNRFDLHSVVNTELSSAYGCSFFLRETLPSGIKLKKNRHILFYDVFRRRRRSMVSQTESTKC